MSATSRIRETRDKVLDLLLADPARPCPITEYVRGGQTKPYMVMGSKTETARNYFDETRFDLTITFTVFSSYNGDEEILEINEWLTNKLHRTTVTLSDGTLVVMRLDLMATQRTPEGDRQLIARFRGLPQ